MRVRTLVRMHIALLIPLALALILFAVSCWLVIDDVRRERRRGL